MTEIKTSQPHLEEDTRKKTIIIIIIMIIIIIITTIISVFKSSHFIYIAHLKTGVVFKSAALQIYI